MTNPRKFLLNQFCRTGVSYRVAAREMGISRTVLHEFLHGRRPAEKKNPEPAIRAWVEAKKRQGAAAIKTAPRFKQLAGLGLTFAACAEALGIRPSVLYRALHQGEWPNRATLEQFETYVKQQKDLRRTKMITKKSLTEEIVRERGLDRDPFTDEIVSEEDLKDTKQSRQALAKMQSAVKKHGWMALTGPKGSGKTIILKRFRSWLKSQKSALLVEPNTVEAQYLGPSGLCDAIMRALGAAYNEHARLEQRGYQLRLAVQAAQASGVKIVVLIDEAHLLRDEVLLACKRLFELDRQFGKPIAFVMVGQEKLATRLKTNMELSEVTQRVDLFELGGLNGELGGYVMHKLERAGLNGASAEIFDRSAIREMSARLKQVTGDTPLAANNLAAAALIVAHDLGHKIITSETIRNIPMSF